ncbi:hypothetical protein ACS0TY_026936 [Phlomoides rotata]
MRLVSLCFWKDLSLFPITKAMRNTLLGLNFSFFCSRKTISIPKSENAEVGSEISVLDLPDLVLECILEKLPPEGLSRMASVCSSLRERCFCDHLWERHMQRKWGRIVGACAFREWYIASRKGSFFFNQEKQKGLFAFIRSSEKNDSVMSRYLALESGKFWFPAQVYNRESGHVGFVLSCYDAMVSYDGKTDTFRARYPPHGTIESGVTWDRLRAPPVDNCPYHLHISDCLYDLQPGDHVEIQWRRNKEFPYGWWYGVVGHLETCGEDANYCRCHNSETVVLEFQQYTRGSRWRRTIVNRKDHREEGNEADGFYGGVRRLCGNHEISRWKKLWPAQVLE